MKPEFSLPCLPEPSAARNVSPLNSVYARTTRIFKIHFHITFTPPSTTPIASIQVALSFILHLKYVVKICITKMPQKIHRYEFTLCYDGCLEEKWHQLSG
jgi:hypothetical protein